MSWHAWENRNKNFLLRLTTKDGSLIMSRGSDKRHWMHQGQFLDDEMIRLNIGRDCREKGVRLVSYTLHDDRLEGIVEWL